MKNKENHFKTKTTQSYILTLLFTLVASNCFSQWKTAEADNIKNDIIITYDVIYDKKLSEEEKNDLEFMSEIIVAFNKDVMIQRRFRNDLKPFNNYFLCNFNTQKSYNCSVSTKSKHAIVSDFKVPKDSVEASNSTNTKTITDFPCEKGITKVNYTPREIFYTKKIGLRYCLQFNIDGFVLEYPGYSNKLGFYTVKAKKVTYDKLPSTFYSLDDFNIESMEAYTQRIEGYKKDAEEHKKKVYDTRMKFIGEKADTFKDISIKQVKIDTKKITDEVIVYNFWFTASNPYKAEIPKLNELQAKYKDKKVHFISIVMDPEYKITPFLEQYPLNYDIIADGKPIANKFGVISYPTNIIVDKKGIIQFYETGFKTDIKERMTSILDKVLAQ